VSAVPGLWIDCPLSPIRLAAGVDASRCLFGLKKGEQSMRHWIKIMGLTLAANAAGSAQTTWQGLSFGWPMGQVKEALLHKGFHLVPNSVPGRQGWDLEPVFDLKLNPTLHLTPNLVFDSSDKLERVTLILATKQHSAEGMEPSLLAMFAGRLVQPELSAKYGVPVSKAGTCDSVSSSDLIGGPGYVKCEVVWKAEGQSISLEWSCYEGPKMLLFSISYKPISSGL
jgi:hypothetical protein